MSKMSQLAMELDEQSAELGYDGLQDALNNGYSVVYDENGAHLEKIDIEKEQEKAHKAWLEEKHEILHLLESVKEDIVNLNGGDNSHVAIDELNYVIDFIEKGEC